MKKNNTVQALWFGMGSFSLFALTLITTALFSRYFDKNDYGTYRQAIYVYNVLLVVFSAGLPKVYSYYLPRYSLSKGKDIVSIVTRLMIIFGLLFSLFLYCFSEVIADILNNHQLSIAIKAFSPIPFFLLPTLGIDGIFSTYKKAGYVVIYNIVTRIFMSLFIVLPVILFKGTYIHAIYGWVISSLVSFFLAQYIIRIPFKNIERESCGIKVKEIFKYSLPIVVASIAGIAIKSADQFYISRYFGTNIFAEYANGFIEIPLIGMITGASSVVLMPIFSQYFHEKTGTEQIITIWKSVIMKSAMMIYPIVVFFVFYSSEIIGIIYSEKYIASSIYFKISMMLNLFNIIVFAPLILSMGQTRLYSIVHIALAVFIWFSHYVIIYIFNDPVAIAVNSTMINCLKIIIFIFIISKLLMVRFYDLFPFWLIAKILIHSTLVMFIVKEFQIIYLLSMPLLIQLFIVVIVYILLLCISGLIVNINYMDPFKPILNSIIK